MMMKVNEYHGYKVTRGEQFPTFRSTWEQAVAYAMNFAIETGIDSKVYGIDENENLHLLKTCRKNAPRT